MTSNPFSSGEPHPVMTYVTKLENNVRQLRWQLTCHRAGSFVSGMFVGGALVTITLVLIGVLR